jgi:hypothetical protein
MIPGEIYISTYEQGNRIIQICEKYECPRKRKNIVYRYLDTPDTCFGGYQDETEFRKDFSAVEPSNISKYSNIITQPINNYN